MLIRVPDVKEWLDPWVQPGDEPGVAPEVLEHLRALLNTDNRFAGVDTLVHPAPPVLRPVRGPVQLGVAALDALLTDQDAAYAGEPCTVARTIAVPTAGVSVVDFDLDAATRDRLYAAGRASAQAFLTGWDFDAYLRGCRANSLPGLGG